MPPRFRLAFRAKVDIDDIWDFIYHESGSVDVADDAQKRIYEEFKFIAEYPGAGHFREELLPPPARFRSVYDYTIAYRQGNEEVEIIAVLHGARDLPELLEDS